VTSLDDSRRTREGGGRGWGHYKEVKNVITFSIAKTSPLSHDSQHLYILLFFETHIICVYHWIEFFFLHHTYNFMHALMLANIVEAIWKHNVKQFKKRLRWNEEKIH
jgi:hypothetical protein